MNVLLWVLQIGLALLYVAGGLYKAFKFDALANQMRALSRGGWRALGVLEMVGAVLLIVPAAANWMRVLTPLAATSRWVLRGGTCALMCWITCSAEPRSAASLVPTR